ncbi:hypothetical protein C8R46DRAFT_134534 [Mycena filopes]|nr:hypothetical protein C8R46DRAFT_134534 [Mycena filopes]
MSWMLRWIRNLILKSRPTSFLLTCTVLGSNVDCQEIRFHFDLPSLFRRRCDAGKSRRASGGRRTASQRGTNVKGLMDIPTNTVVRTLPVR